MTATTDHGRTLFGRSARYPTGLQELAGVTWAWLQPNGELGESNAGLVAGDGSALLVDTLWDLKLTGKMLEQLGAVSDVPIEIVFNTHSDGDHCWGNQLLADAQIVSTAKAARLMLDEKPVDLRRMQGGSKLIGAIGKLPVPLVGTLDVGRLPRLPLKEMSTMMSPYDFRGIELTLPTRTFEGRLALDVGGREVELIEVGPAHTAGDAIAWVPDVRVCFAADILFIGGTPIMWAGPVASWLSALDTALALEADTYVPGHGPLCTVAEVRVLRDYFEWVAEAGVSQLERGVAPVKAARKLLLSDEFEQLPWAAWDDPARLVVTLVSEQNARNGGGDHVGKLARARAIVAMQRTVADLERRRA